MNPPLAINQLVKQYGKHLAVDQVTFSIEPGEVFGLLGPNGAGKTSIISTIMTLQTPTSGQIEIFGKPPTKAKHLVGFVPQEIVHHGFFTVLQILSYHIRFYGIANDHTYVEYLLKRLHLYEHRHKLVSQLSGGMKRRLMIAKALLHRPKLLLLDEPTAGIDIQLRNSLWEFIDDLRKENISILLTTHYLEEAENLCDRIGILKNGRLTHIDQTQNLIKQLSTKQVSLALKEPLPSISHALLVKQEEKHLHFRIPSTMVLGQLLNELAIPQNKIHDIAIRPGNLEEVMEEVLK